MSNKNTKPAVVYVTYVSSFLVYRISVFYISFSRTPLSNIFLSFIFYIHAYVIFLFFSFLQVRASSNLSQIKISLQNNNKKKKILRKYKEQEILLKRRVKFTIYFKTYSKYKTSFFFFFFFVLIMLETIEIKSTL
jgi:hypothetical protein